MFADSRVYVAGHRGLVGSAKDGRAVRAEAFAEGDAEALGRWVAEELLAGGAGELLAEA